MRSVAVCVFAAAVIAGMGSANAGDRSSKGSLKDSPTGTAVDWTGFYVGVHGGYSKGDWDGQLRSSAGTPTAPPTVIDINGEHRTLDADGWLGGLQLGYNRQIGNFVLGFETDVSWSEFDGDATYRTRNFLTAPDQLYYDKEHKPKLDYFGTVRGRIGYAFGNFLPYATGGLAWGKTQEDMVVDQYASGPVWATGLTPNEASGHADERHIGWTAGAGVETKVGSGWSLKAEWLYVDLGKADYLFIGQHNNGTFAGQSFATDAFPADLTFDVYRIGLNYQFSN